MNPIHWITRYLPWLLVLSLFILLAGCGDDDEGSTSEPGTLDRLWSYPVIQGCGTCHEGGNTGPDLTSKSRFRNNLVDQTIDDFDWSSFTFRTSNCSGDLDLVAPHFPNRSVVLSSLSADYSFVCDDTALNAHIGVGVEPSPAVVNDLILWIEQGAQP